MVVERETSIIAIGDAAQQPDSHEWNGRQLRRALVTLLLDESSDDEALPPPITVLRSDD